MVHGLPLRDAQHLKQKCDWLHQDVDHQASKVNRRKTKDVGSNPDHVAKLQAVEQKLDDITSAMETMGQNTISTFSDVESQQHITILQKMLAMVDAERAYALCVTSILDLLHDKIESKVQKNSVSHSSSHGATPPAIPFTLAREMFVDPSEYSHHTSNRSYDYEDSMGGHQQTNGNKVPSPTKTKSFYAMVTQNFEGQEYGELSISIGDEVLIQQMIPMDWSEEIYNRQSEWFPSSFVKKKPPVQKAQGRPRSRHGSR